MHTTMQSPPLIISAKLDTPTQQALDALRYRFFPSNRYVLPAHLTLFHALPHALMDQVRVHLAGVCQQAPLQAALEALHLRNRGFAVPVRAPELVRLHSAMRRVWAGHLTPQDTQTLRPHITLQNKVSSAEAEADFAVACRLFVPGACRIDALCLWQYQGGPWHLLQEFAFG